jgi:hypothetical protein
MTQPGPVTTVGTRKLMIAVTEPEQQGLAGRLPGVPARAVFWASPTDAAGLAAGGFAQYAPEGTVPPAPEPPWTAAQTPGAGAAAHLCRVVSLQGTR